MNCLPARARLVELRLKAKLLNCCYFFFDSMKFCRDLSRIIFSQSLQLFGLLQLYLRSFQEIRQRSQLLKFLLELHLYDINESFDYIFSNSHLKIAFRYPIPCTIVEYELNINFLLPAIIILKTTKHTYIYLLIGTLLSAWVASKYYNFFFHVQKSCCRV